MKAQEPKRPAIELAAAEVDEILACLRAARILKDLSGKRRRQVAEALAELTALRRAAHGAAVEVPVDLAAKLLRSMAQSQEWFLDLISEFDGCTEE